MNLPATQSPAPIPAPKAPQPAAKPPRAKRRTGWLWLAAVAGVAALGYYGWTQYQQNLEKERLAAARQSIRTVPAGPGKLDQTIRLTGTTSAERFVSLVTPQLRGSRSGRGRSSSGSGSAQQSGTTNVASRGASIASTASAVTSAPGGGGGGQATAGFTPPSASSAMRSATTRTGGSRTSGGGGGQSSGAAAQQQAMSESLGSDGLGSTGGSLGAGMGGGGGGGGARGASGDFMLVLQELAPAGSKVKKGDVVAEFDRENMLLRVDDYRSSVAQQEANFKKMQAELKMYRESHRQTIATAKAALEKARLDMKTIPVLSEIDAERVKLALEEAEAQYKQLLSEVKYVEISEKAQLRNAELDLKASQLELRRSEAIADRMLSVAAIDGMVVMQNMLRGSEFGQIQEGDQLNPGQLFMQIVDTSTMVVNASINQVDAERVRVGQKATVRFDAYPGLALPAHVRAVGAVTKTGGFRANFVKEIPVVLKLDEVDPRVIPDLSVSVDVILETEEAQASIPLSAVFRDGGGDSQPYVYVREGNTWRKREVELGTENFTHAAVRGGLNPGDVVALEKPEKKT
jgi:multidrug efflux pump subunit AcrA (membrane-fusion protein)